VLMCACTPAWRCNAGGGAHKLVAHWLYCANSASLRKLRFVFSAMAVVSSHVAVCGWYASACAHVRCGYSVFCDVSWHGKHLLHVSIITRVFQLPH
jgi:hypothetical protein